MKPISSNTVFHVSHLEKSIAFYKDKLGFSIDFKFGEPPTYAGLSLGNVCLHISSAYPYKNNTGHCHPCAPSLTSQSSHERQRDYSQSGTNPSTDSPRSWAPPQPHRWREHRKAQGLLSLLLTNVALCSTTAFGLVSSLGV